MDNIRALFNTNFSCPAGKPGKDITPFPAGNYFKEVKLKKKEAERDSGNRM